MSSRTGLQDVATQQLYGDVQDRVSEIRFEEDLRSEILRYLPVPDAKASTELTGLPIRHLLVRFLTWRDRLVDPHPRNVHKSRELLSGALYASKTHEIALLLAKIARGEDVTCHLSRSLKFGYERRAQGKLGGRDIDGLLNDWGIHHLHISQTLEMDGFVQRSNAVLAVVFLQSDVYIIDMMIHGEWTEDILVRIVIENWPQANIFVEINGLINASPLTSNERKKLRGCGISTFTVVDGRSYFAACGGISGNITPSRAVILANGIIRKLTDWSENLSSLEGLFRESPLFNLKFWPVHPSYRVTSVTTQDRYCFGIVEEKTGLFLALG